MKSKSSIYKELVAPNGKKSNLTPEQYALVRTKAFKDWFGDWENDPANASKVIDENGEPLVVYHGTNKDFSVFKSKKNTKDNNRNYVSGMWFFADPIGNSLSQEDREYFYQEGNAKSMAEDWVYDENGSLSKVLECFICVKNPIEVDGYAEFLHWKDDKDVQKSIKNKKVDGWFIHGSTTDGGVYRDDINVFYPEQIKLADGTNTTFDSSNPDIRYGDGGEVNSNSFMKWYVQWYKGISDKMNIVFYLPSVIAPFKEENVVVLDVFEKINQNIDAKPYLKEIVEKADEYGVVIYLEPTPRHNRFQDNLEKKKKITREYLIEYYKRFGFQLTPNNQFMKRLPKSNRDIRYDDGGKVPFNIHREFNEHLEKLPKFGYHGTQSETLINPRPSKDGRYGEGFYLTLDPDTAEYFGRFTKTSLGYSKENESANVFQFDLRGLNLKYYKRAEDMPYIDFEELNKKNYDGIYLYNEGEIVVFNIDKLQDGKLIRYRYENGGEMKSMKHGTITEGASHDDGGIKVLNKSTNQILEVEGGEGVVNKHSMASDKKVKLNGKEMTICEAVSQLNQMDGNGVKFDCDKVEHRQFIEKMDLGGELEKGIRTEQEHIQTLKELYSKQITPEQASEKIAKEHLAENPAYYSKLQALEESKKNNADLIMKLGGMTNEHTYTFEDFGLIKDFKENPFHKLAEMLKKSNNFCDVEPNYCLTSLDIDRKDMPQVYEEYIPDYVDFLEKQGIDSQMKYNVEVSDLKPTQKNISIERISKILHRLLSGYYTGENGQLLNPLKRVVIATKDGYLLDGHHRWATSLFLSPKNTITVLEINADIADLIPITKGFKKTEYQEFMFGGRVEVLDKTSSTPEAVKTFTAYKGGFPKKGLVVSPLLVYERNVREYKFAEDAFMIEIPSRSLQDYLKPSTLRLAKYLKDNLQKTSGERFYPYGLGDTFYPRLSLGIADYSDFRRNDVGTIAVSKQGQTRAIFFVPSESQLKLLNDDTFLEHFLQALNLVTKTPFAPVNIPKEKKQKVFVKNISGTSQKLKDATIVQSFDTEGIDNQLVALQKLMESFTEDEIEVRRYILNEIDKLRGEKEKKLNESLFTTNFTGLLDLYASKVSLQQLPLKKNPCNLTTPSGTPSELDMLQYSIVRTPAFKNWFGDWEEAFKSKNYNGVSKAINERTGEPLVMYHGKSFMKTEMTSFSTPINVNFPIKYFAEESNYSAYFADLDSSKQSLSAIFEFFIRCVNPMDFTSIGTETITPEIFRKVVEAIYGYEIKSPMIMEGVPQKVWQILRGNVPMLNEIRQNTNFDGFKLYEDNPDAPNKGFAEKTLDFAVYSNTAMKAADGRNTTFLKDVESFRFEQGGLVNN